MTNQIIMISLSSFFKKCVRCKNLYEMKKNFYNYCYFTMWDANCKNLQFSLCISKKIDVIIEKNKLWKTQMIYENEILATSDKIQRFIYCWCLSSLLIFSLFLFRSLNSFMFWAARNHMALSLSRYAYVSVYGCSCDLGWWAFPKNNRVVCSTYLMATKRIESNWKLTTFSKWNITHKHTHAHFSFGKRNIIWIHVKL